MNKKVSFSTKPTSKAAAATPDAWVSSRAGEASSEAMKRLTIDIPASLHRSIKMQCAGRGTKIADEVREMLLQKYGNP